MLMMAVTLVTTACVDVVIYPDEGADEDGTTTSMESTASDETAVEDTTDESTGTMPDLPSDEATDSTTDTTDETTDTGEAEFACCTCPDLATSEYECWPWTGQTVESCIVDQAMAAGEPTVWCETVDGYPADCLAQCG